MPAPATADEFLDLIRRSGVAEDARLGASLKRLTEGSGIPSEAKPLAEALVREGLLTFFQAEQLLQGKWKRFTIGKYKVLERLGAGGMGQVFLCEHKLMRRRVAVKVLPAAKAQDPSSLERFYREARAVAALDHPNIVRAYDIDHDESLHFLVMEYVDGANLQDLVKKAGPLDPVRACHYIFGAAVGLQHAHEMGLVHRDIKPGNILVDRAGVVKILDMGLARFFHDEEDQVTRKYDETILGTADYLSPEQALDSHGVDIRADIYSLGGTYYYLLTGKPPFPDGNVTQKLLWHQNREPTPVRSLRPEIPEEIAQVVARMMAKEPAQRYQTPAEVMAALAVWAQAPIAPPTDAEMPQLSPALVGTGSGQTTTRIPSGPPTLSNGPSTVTAATVASGWIAPIAPKSDTPRTPPPTARPAATPATGISPVAMPVKTAPRPVAKPAATTGGIWEELTSETQTDAKTDTDRPRKPAAAPPPRRRNRPDTPPNRRRILFLALGGGLLLTLLGVGAYVLFGKKSSTDTQTSAGGRTWYVAPAGNGPDPDRTLTTLRGALEQAGPNDTVMILTDRLDEPPLRLADAGRGAKKGITVQAGTPSGTVVWSPRATGRGMSALELIAVEDFHLSGLILELGGSVESGIAVVGSCPGLTLDGVTVQNPKTAGFHFQRAIGEADRPIRMHKCRVVAGPKLDAAVLFTLGNKLIQVENCRLEGPGQDAVKIDGIVLETELRDNRIYNFDVGVQLTGKLSATASYSLTVANNTFHTLGKAGLAVEHPLSGPKQHLTLTQNYFAHTKQILTSPALKLPGLKASENARDATTKDGKLKPAALPVPDYNLPSPNPASDGEFLRPSDGKLSAVGPNRVTVGARPE
jgi:serine/threonine protein kinase